MWPYFSFLVNSPPPPLSHSISNCVSGYLICFLNFLGKTQSLSPGQFWHIRSHMYTWQFVTIMTNVRLGKKIDRVLARREGAFYGWFIRTKDKGWASEIFIDFSTLKYFWKVQVWADAKLSFVNKLSVITEAQETFSSKCQRIWPNIYLCPRFIFKEQKKLLKIYLCQNNCRLQFKNHLRNNLHL